MQPRRRRLQGKARHSGEAVITTETSDASTSVLKSEEDLRKAVGELLPAKDISHTTIGDFRKELEKHFGLAAGALEPQKELIDSVISKEMEAPAAPQAGDDDLGEENEKASKEVYLITFAHPRQKHAQDGTELKAPGSYSQQQIITAVVDCVQRTDGNRISPLPLKYMVDYREKHADEFPHDHVALKSDRGFKYNPVKGALLKNYGLASHWSCDHIHYASAVRYGYMPSAKKSLAELDPKPVVWAAEGDHPRLEAASRLPVTAKAIADQREERNRVRAEKGKKETKFRDLDLWPVVVRESIMDAPDAAEKMMAYAKRCGGLAMSDFCFKNFERLPALIAKCWKVEKVEEFVERQEKTRVAHLTDALSMPCACGGRWIPCAQELFEKNGISQVEWVGAVLHSLKHGRSKGSLVCHAGLHGNEGKSFMFGPLPLVFGDDNVFALTSKSGFPLLNLERSKLTLLDDWRFNEDLIGYPLQLLWFEGKPFVIVRPQNHHTGHLKYTKNDPVFITTLESDITSLERKKIAKGDIDMMLRRLKIFRFHHQLTEPAEIPACAHCFACLLLRSGEATRNAGHKRPFTGNAPEAKRQVTSWQVADVLSYLDTLELTQLKDVFTENAIDGRLLAQLSEEELSTELGATKLQARKIKSRLNDHL